MIIIIVFLVFLKICLLNIKKVQKNVKLIIDYREVFVFYLEFIFVELSISAALIAVVLFVCFFLIKSSKVT